MKRKTTLEQDLEICKLYASGKKQHEIAKMFATSRTAIVHILQRNKIITRKAGEWAKKYDIDETIFEKIDCEWKAYFLGYMYADGNIQKYEAAIQLNEKDKEILEIFSKLIYKSPRPLSYSKGKFYKIKENRTTKHKIGELIYTKPAWRFRIINKKIVEDLVKLGLIPCKSLILDFPNFTQVPDCLMRHFIRGYFDGDGCIQIKKRTKMGCKGKMLIWNRTTLSIVSSPLFISKLKKFLDDELGITIMIRKQNDLKTGTLVTDNLSYLKKIYDYLYKNATIFLARKKEIFDKIKDI